jgi:hypothetical protein
VGEPDAGANQPAQSLSDSPKPDRGFFEDFYDLPPREERHGLRFWGLMLLKSLGLVVYVTIALIFVLIGIVVWGLWAGAHWANNGLGPALNDGLGIPMWQVVIIGAGCAYLSFVVLVVYLAVAKPDLTPADDERTSNGPPGDDAADS